MPEGEEKIGGIKKNYWYVIGAAAGLLAYLVYRHYRNVSAANAANQAAQSTVGIPLGGSAGNASTDLAGPTGTTSPISTLSDWLSSAAHFATTSLGADPAQTQNALQAYSNGECLTQTEFNIIDRALGALGMPPDAPFGGVVLCPNSSSMGTQPAPNTGANVPATPPSSPASLPATPSPITPTAAPSPYTHISTVPNATILEAAGATIYGLIDGTYVAIFQGGKTTAAYQKYISTPGTGGFFYQTSAFPTSGFTHISTIPDTTALEQKGATIYGLVNGAYVPIFKNGTTTAAYKPYTSQANNPGFFYSNSDVLAHA